MSAFINIILFWLIYHLICTLELSAMVIYVIGYVLGMIQIGICYIFVKTGWDKVK